MSPDPCYNTSLNPLQKLASLKLHFALTMLCRDTALQMVTNAGEGEGLMAWQALTREYEPMIAAQHSADCLALLEWDFSGDFTTAYESFKRARKQYETRSQESFSDNIAIGTIVRKLPKGDLKTHLMVNMGKLKTMVAFEAELLAVKKVFEVVGATPTAMDVGALDAVGKGGAKGSGGGGRGAVVREMKCFYCNKKGHMKAECRKLVADKKAGTVQGTGGGKGGGGGQPGKSSEYKFQGTCNKCGKKGHKQAQCKSNINTLETVSYTHLTLPTSDLV